MSKLAYVGVPYSDPDPAVRQARFDLVNRTVSFLKTAGCLCFSPISMLHPIALAHGLPVDWEYWKQFDLAMLERSQALLIVAIDGWMESVGVQEEIRIATELGIPIGYLLDPENQAIVMRFAQRSGLIEIDMKGRAWGEPFGYIARET